MRRGFFVTGTDTGVGKTVVSAALMRFYRSTATIGVRRVSDPNRGSIGKPGDPPEFRNKNRDLKSGSDTRLTPKFWKPIQTGIEQDDDTGAVAWLGGCPPDEILDEGIRLERPLSPHLSARLAGRTITVQQVTDIWRRVPDDHVWIVEGAGGAIVPLNDHEMMIDLMVAVGLPVVVAARTALGTINHTLLTLEALRARRLTVAGVMLVGDANEENRKAIAAYGRVEILGEMPRFSPLTPDALGAWVSAALPHTLGRMF